MESRLQKIAPPELGLNAALQLLDSLGGIGTAGPLVSKSLGNLTLVGTEKGDMKLEGNINVLKLYAQMMFYSRAGGIEPPFSPNATVEEVHHLLAWVHWSRSVLSVNNIKAATEGSAMAHAFLGRLRQYKQTNDYDATATIFVGHNGTIDDLGTAPGVKWQQPYISTENFSTTPPGGTLHVTEYSGKIELSYLYPVFLNGNGTSWNLFQSDNIESVPLIFDPPIDNLNVTVDKEMTVIWEVKDGRTGLDVLRDRVLSVLDKYPRAVKCFNARDVGSTSEAGRLASWLPRMVFAILLFSSVCLFLLFRKRKHKQKHLVVETHEDDDDSLVSRDIEIM